MTLVEVLIYVALLAMLLVGFLRYLYSLDDMGTNLYNQVSKAYAE